VVVVVVVVVVVGRGGTGGSHFSEALLCLRVAESGFGGVAPSRGELSGRSASGRRRSV